MEVFPSAGTGLQGFFDVLCYEKLLAEVAHPQPELQSDVTRFGMYGLGAVSRSPCFQGNAFGKKKGDNCIKLREAFTWEISPAFRHLK